MQTLSAEFRVELSAADVWRKMSDLSRPDAYVQGLTAVEFTTEATQGVGASRRVTQGKSFKLDETVAVWEEGSLVSLRLHRGEKGPIPPFTEHFFDYGLEQRGDEVWLVNRMRYEVGLGPLGSLLDKLVLRRVMQAQLRDVTLAQKLFYETGEPVTPQILKSAKANLE